LCLASTSRKPEQIGHCCEIRTAFWMMQISQGGQVQQNKRQLEWSPAAIGRDILLFQGGGLAASAFFGVKRMNTLLPHGVVHKSKSSCRLDVLAQQIDTSSNAGQRPFTRLKSLACNMLIGCEADVRIIQTCALLSNPLSVRGGEREQMFGQLSGRHLCQFLHIQEQPTKTWKFLDLRRIGPGDIVARHNTRKNTDRPGGIIR